MARSSAGPIDLVLVGHRPGALHAASRLGLGVLLVEEEAPAPAARRRVAAWVEVGPEADEAALLAAVREALGGQAPRAVLATGERGVLAAAALRAAHGVAGIGPVVARAARDKPLMKAAARRAGIPCADWRTLDADVRADELVADLGLPLVLKPRDGTGGRAMTKSVSAVDVARALDRIPAEERPRWVAERWVAGIEMSIESFVADSRILFTNPTEYFVPAAANVAPAVLPEAELGDLLALNARVLGTLGVERGMTHLEVFRTPEGPRFGEVAVRPPGGRIMRLLRRAYGFDPWEAAIRIELGEAPEFPARPVGAAGVWMLHPGPGRVASVRGLAAARRLPGVRKLVCRVRTGSEVGPRSSTGADVGWIEVGGRDREEVARTLTAAHDLVRIEMEGRSDRGGSARDPR
jgi:biotin carboxylase